MDNGNAVAITTKTYAKDGSYTVSYTTVAELNDTLATLARKVQPIAHAASCACLKCEQERLRLSWQ